MKKAVVLLSGGLDSSTCLAMAIAEGYECHAISFDYGQRHAAELDAATLIAKQFSCTTHHIYPIALGAMGGSALTDSAIEVPDYQDSDTIPVTYVPARNTVFLSIALGYAEVVEAEAIFIGVSSVDYSGYPDCRPAFIEAFERLANLATKMGTEGAGLRIHAPLMHLSKAQTIQAGMALAVDYSMTVSCYRLSADGLACGRCDSCVLRRQGFLDAGIPDPTRYRVPFR